MTNNIKAENRLTRIEGELKLLHQAIAHLKSDLMSVDINNKNEITNVESSVKKVIDEVGELRKIYSGFSSNVKVNQWVIKIIVGTALSGAGALLMHLLKR